MPFSSPEASKQTFDQIRKIASRYLGFQHRKGQLRYLKPDDLISSAAYYLHAGAASAEEAVKKSINDERRAARKNPAPAYGHGAYEDHEDNAQDFSLDDLNSGLYRGHGTKRKFDPFTKGGLEELPDTRNQYESYCDSKYKLWMEHFSS